MATKELFFNTIKEGRSWYFVEYGPPITSYPFATLNFVVPGAADPSDVAAAMEHEVRTWLARYPVPIMVTPFDRKGDVLRLKGVRPADHLMGSIDKSTNEVQLYWRLLRDDELPAALDAPDLRRVFSDVPFKTSADLRAESDKRSRQLRIGWAITFLWFGVGPVLWAIAEYAGPEWVGAVVFGYALWKAFVNAMQMLGKWKKSPEVARQEDEGSRMRHHHYHCEKNPVAFSRLKLENFERLERERVEQEAASLNVGKN